MTTDVLAYCRVSTDEQARTGHGLDAQHAAIAEAADRRGWTVVDWITDEGLSGKTLARPGIQAALERLENGGPSVLAAAKLDRISRSAIDFLTLVARAETHGWSLILLEPDVDMTTPTGRFTAGILAHVAQLERELISARTRDALAAAKRNGVRVGRPAYGFKPGGAPDVAEQAVIAQIRALHAEGASTRAVADLLDQGGVPTRSGRGGWKSAQIARILRRPWPV